MREVIVEEVSQFSEAQTFRACLAAILELSYQEVPDLAGNEEVVGWRLRRWLGGLGLGLVEAANPSSFSWAGPWIARIHPGSQGACRAVVMFGVPSGVAWDPSGVTAEDGWRIKDGYVVAALDIALAPPIRLAASPSTGTIEGIFFAPTAGAPTESVESVRLLAGHGLEGDRHVSGKGTFPSGLPGSALTLIEAEVCESFTPTLRADEHRRNVVTRGISLNSLVGRKFKIGDVICGGMRLCEPCTVVDRYASRPVLRQLVHRGGLRADILNDGEIHRGDTLQPLD